MIDWLNKLARAYAPARDHYMRFDSCRWIYIDASLQVQWVAEPTVWSFWYRPLFWRYVWEHRRD